MKPDSGSFTFSINKTAKTIPLATEYVNSLMAKVFDAVKDKGVEEKDIKTLTYNLYPKYDYVTVDDSACIGCKKSQRVFSGYQLDQTVRVVINDIDKVGEVLDKVTVLGVQNVSGLSFDVSDKTSAQNEARNMAIKEAKVKAEAMAKSLGVKLVRITGFYEDRGGVYPMYEKAMGGDMVTSSSAPAVLPTGENQITSNVTITYEIR